MLTEQEKDYLVWIWRDNRPKGFLITYSQFVKNDITDTIHSLLVKGLIQNTNPPDNSGYYYGLTNKGQFARAMIAHEVH
jgi:hypothetical protein